jgi:hypothetical protein
MAEVDRPLPQDAGVSDYFTTANRLVVNYSVVVSTSLKSQVQAALAIVLIRPLPTGSINSPFSAKSGGCGELIVCCPATACRLTTYLAAAVVKKIAPVKRRTLYWMPTKLIKSAPGRRA